MSTNTFKNDTKTDVRSELEVWVDDDAQAFAVASKSKPIKRIKMKKVPSALNLSRRASVLLQRASSMTLRKRGKKKKKSGNFHYRSRPAEIEEIEEIDVDVQDESSKTKAKPTSTSSSPKCPTPRVNYEVFQWAWFLTLCILAIADRFTWNIWPRQIYTIGTGSAGSDRLSGYKPGPWSVVLYDVLARVSGRYSIICYNFLLITRLECLEHILTSSFVRKYLLDTSNIVNANIRLHSWNGIGLCVMTLLHVWSILFPCITHGYTAVVVPGVWEWPASERTPVKCSVSNELGCWPGDANPELKQMGLEVDDVFRMVEMTIFLCILLPISVRWFTSKWHAGIHLHRLVNLIYFVDIVRRHTHPHSWILNTPVFALYLFDKHMFTYFYKRNKSPAMRRIRLGQDFMVLYWDSPYGFTDTIGPDYFMLMNNSSFLEQRHSFTCFENRSGRELEDTNEEEDGIDNYKNESGDGHKFKWTVGVVIRVFRRSRSPVLGTRDRVSHTQRMYEEEPLMLVTGPRQGEMSEMVRLELLRDRNDKLILLGAGSAINFILDGLQWCTVNTPIRKKISLVYTTRDFDLFQWAMSVISNLVPVCETRGIFFDVKMAYTGSMTENSSHDIESTIHSNAEDSSYDIKSSIHSNADLSMSMHGSVQGSTRDHDLNLDASMHSLDASTHSTRSIKSPNKSVSTQSNRFDLYGEIGAKSTVFCQGGAGLKNIVEAVCKKVGARFYGGRGGAREDMS